MVLDDGGDATHLLVKKYNSVFKVCNVFIVMYLIIVILGMYLSVSICSCVQCAFASNLFNYIYYWLPSNLSNHIKNLTKIEDTYLIGLFIIFILQ